MTVYIRVKKIMIFWTILLYAQVEFSDDSKSEDDKVGTEVLTSGVWFLPNEGASVNNDNHHESVVNDTFHIEIPSQYHDNQKKVRTKEVEIDNGKKHNAYEESDYCGQSILGSRWVVADKNATMKARFVVKGFHEQEYPRADSPTASKEFPQTLSFYRCQRGFSVILNE